MKDVKKFVAQWSGRGYEKGAVSSRLCKKKRLAVKLIKKRSKAVVK